MVKAKIMGSQSKWSRVNPAGLLVLAQPGGAMLNIVG